MTRLRRTCSFHRPYRPELTTLERRLMLAADVAAHTGDIASNETTSPGSTVSSQSIACNRVSTPEIVFIDSAMDDIESWSSSIPKSAELVLINAGDDAIDEMTRVLEKRCDVRSIHVISHGSEGVLQIGSQSIDIQQLREHRQHLQSWQAALSPDADILLYGCNVAGNASGQQFIEAFAQWTQCDVAGSDNLTGSPTRDADWELEYQIGEINSAVVVSKSWREQFAGTLSITIYAAGETGQETMELLIDGTSVARFENVLGNVAQREFQSFTYETTDKSITADRIRVQFVGDVYEPGVIDRNLWVDRIEINGVAYETESDNVFSNGTWVSGLGIAPGNRNTETLHTDGYFQYANDEPTGYYRSIDGSKNNLDNPDWGTVGEQLQRVPPASYADGIESPAGEDRPSAREISNTVASQTPGLERNENNLSAMVYVWGQFIDHDIDLTQSQGQDGESFPISVPVGDPFFDPDGTGTQTISLSRSRFDETTGGDTGVPREHLNEITSWIDGSMVYGSTDELNASLREYSGGRMRVSDEAYLPVSDGKYLAGDIRFDENVNLTAMHTLWVREHNYWASLLSNDFPEWTDEQLFQESRAIVVAEIQAITMNEFLPALLGDTAIATYAGYASTIDPSIATEFSTAGFRIGHTLLNDEVFFMDDNGVYVEETRLLANAFMHPELVPEYGVDASMKSVISIQAQAIDTEIVDSVRNFLFGQPGAGGFDLASLNIQRGRDHGLADYNTTRAAYGLERVTDFDQITSNVELQNKLRDLYGSVDNIDLWVGTLAEDHVPGAALGELNQTIIAEQFTRLRDGDRFWYENLFAGKQLEDLRSTKLADVIRRNTGLENMQDNVFYMQSVIEGQVAGANAGIEVLLRNADGQELTRTVTSECGYFQFGSIARVGNYTLELSANPEATSTVVRITRGDEWVWANIAQCEYA